MSTEPATRRRESIFAAVLLFPLRAVERARGWRRVALLLVYVLFALPILAMLYRRSQLAGLPDLGDSYGNVAASVADDRNAFVCYLQATERFTDMTAAEGESFSKANLDWTAADNILGRWIAAHKDAISLLREGSERPEASLELAGRPAGAMSALEKQEVVRRLSWIGNAALFEAGRLRAEGDTACAWGLLKAVIRTSRDTERAAPSVWCRGTAMTLAQYAVEPLSAWAKDQSVSIAQLRRALDDIAAAEALTPPISSFYRAEFEAAEATLANLPMLIAERARVREAIGASDAMSFAPNLDTFLRGEPERTRRVLHLLAANDLAWCDRPVAERPEFAVPNLRIYQADSTAPAASRMLEPEELARWAESILINPALPWRMGELEKYERNDRWSMGLLKEAVAVPLFTHEMGRRPTWPIEALRRYFPLPVESPDRDQAEPVPEMAPAESGQAPAREPRS
jgi:hypothetical protein